MEGEGERKRRSRGKGGMKEDEKVLRGGEEGREERSRAREKGRR